MTGAKRRTVPSSSLFAVQGFGVELAEATCDQLPVRRGPEGGGKAAELVAADVT